jgi:hypothetical protein
MYGHCRFLDTLHAAAIFLYRMVSPLHLTLTGFTAQLGHQFIELADTGRPQGMTFGFQAA